MSQEGKDAKLSRNVRDFSAIGDGSRHAPSEGEQLSLDLGGQDLSLAPRPTSVQIFEDELRGTALLLELARALGEQRAAADIELFRLSLKQA